MKAYKLLRKLSDGNLYPLFIHKTYSTPINECKQNVIPRKDLPLDVGGIAVLYHLRHTYQ